MSAKLKDLLTHELKAVQVSFLTLQVCALQAPWWRLE